MMYTKVIAQTFYSTLIILFCLQAAEAGTMMTSQNIVAFTIRLSEKEAVLEDPANQKAAMWDLAFQRIADRNMPWIEITNASESVAEITEFLLTLGDNAMEFNFGEATFNRPILPSTNNPADIGMNATIEQGGDQLRVTFSNFDPGQTVRFRIDLEAEDPGAHPHPDFRRVLFDGVPISSANGVQDNAHVMLTYSNGAVLEQRVPEFMVDPFARFFEGSLRPLKFMEPVQVFEFGGRIPEPSTWAMAALSLICAAGYASRRRVQRSCLN